MTTIRVECQDVLAARCVVVKSPASSRSSLRLDIPPYSATVASQMTPEPRRGRECARIPQN